MISRLDPHPELVIAAALRRAGRQRNLQATAETIQAALRAPPLEAHPGVVGAYTAAVRSLVTVIAELVTQTEVPRSSSPSSWWVPGSG